MVSPEDYLNLFNSCKITDDTKKLRELDFVSKVAITHQGPYQIVERFVSIPWVLIAVIHFRESNQDFSRHLHNGDSLLAKTIHVPAGRPATGKPPFTWIESATDAFTDIWRPGSWSTSGCLEFLERYNGLGYQKRGLNTPYLWNYTDKYVAGLYTADGQFNPSKTEARPGCVALVKTLVAKGVSFDFTALDANDSSLH